MPTNEPDSDKVRQGVMKIGTGTDARVNVVLRDNAKLSGFVDDTSLDGFTVIDPATGASTDVAYSNVKRIKGHSLSTGAKIAIWSGIAAAIVMVALLIWIMNPD